MEDIVALCKRRGFIFQSSEIYGGLQGMYDYGPLGVELKNNLKNEFQLSVVVKENIDTLESIKMLYKKELIEIETQSEDFQKVLAKFPNAKIIDIEEVERGDQNDG